LSAEPNARKPVIALNRHSGTEAPGLGATPGAYLFLASLERSLRRNHTVVPVPPYYYALDAQPSVAVAYEILSKVDACVFALPPHPVDMDAFFLVRAHLKRRIPFLYMPLGEFPRGAWAYRHIHRNLTADDVITFASQADKAIYDALVEAAPSRNVVIPWGVQSARFRRAREAREATRRHLGLPDEAVVFVSHGRLTPEKNPHGAIMLFARIAEAHPQARLWIIGALPEEVGRGPGPRRVSQLGDGPTSQLFRRLLDDPRLAERVLFWGGVSQQALPQVLGAADVGVNLTLFEDENFGYSTVEAMASGLPVIGAHWGGLKDTIAHGETGFSVATRIMERGIAFDLHQAAGYAARLATDAPLRRRMGAAALRRVRREFDHRRFAHDVTQELARMCERPQGGGGPHRWSPLGEKLVARYTSDRPGPHGAIAATPIPPVDDRFIAHPLLRDLLAHYATDVAGENLEDGATFVLATDLLELAEDRLRSADPRYPLDIALTERMDRALVRLLQEMGGADADRLAQAAADVGCRAAVTASLDRLRLAGAVIPWRTLPDARPRNR
jgi:glycosyltransferase involved in cell wall biosynthesis